MLKVAVDNFKYHRILLDHVTPADTKCLKEEYDYSFVISYGKFDDDDYEIVEKKAAIVDLSHGMDVVFGNFNATTRNLIRKFDRNDDMAISFDIKCDNEFYEFHQICEKERNWKPAPIEELDGCILIGTKYRDQYLAGVSCYIHENKIRVGRIFSRRRSPEFKEITSNMISAASRRIIFELCNWAIQNNIVSLDLGGVSFDEGNKNGITKYKLFFGPRVISVKIGRFLKPGSEAKKLELEESGYDIT